MQNRRATNTNMIGKPAAIIITAICLLILFLAVSKMDAQDEAQEQAYYCEMVNSGDWPNFKEINCTKG